jgi:hypothetical protein
MFDGKPSKAPSWCPGRQRSPFRRRAGHGTFTQRFNVGLGSDLLELPIVLKRESATLTLFTI